MTPRLPWRWYPHLAVAVMVAACSQGDQGEVVARVNGARIRSPELEFALQDPAAKPGGSGRRRAVEKMVVEELLAQQYLRTTPGSAEVDDSAVAAARRELLARRYVASLVAAVPPPGAPAIRAYYRDHPVLYAERRRFLLREVDIAVPAARVAEVRELIAAAPSVDALVRRLPEARLTFTSTEAQRTGDELGESAAMQLARLNTGQVAVLTTATGLRVLQLLRAHEAGLDERAAWPLIERELWARARAEAVNREVRRLSRTAAISILDGGAREETASAAPNPVGRMQFSPESPGKAQQQPTGADGLLK